jgi:hypothetical protein
MELEEPAAKSNDWRDNLRIMVAKRVPHSHGGGAHSHRVGPGADVRRLWTALVLILGFMATEVVAGILFHSLALLSDAGHLAARQRGAEEPEHPWQLPAHPHRPQ